jgi:hypothetical protein
MRGTAPKLLAYCSLMLLCVALTNGRAGAAQCADIYPGAQKGPPLWAHEAACFVRWRSGSPENEDQLLAQCHATTGARYVHFERAQGMGYSICIFKILDAQPPPILDDGSVSSQLHPTRDKKGDAESPLGEMVALVTAWNENCLREERGKNPLAARNCWKAGAEAIEQFTAEHSIAPEGLEGKLEQLRTAWLKRAEHIGAYGLVAAASTRDESAVEAVGKRPSGPSVVDAVALREGAHDCHSRWGQSMSCDLSADNGAAVISKPAAKIKSSTSLSQARVRKANKTKKPEITRAAREVIRVKHTSAQIEDAPQRRKKKVVQKNSTLQKALRKKPAQMYAIAWGEQPQRHVRKDDLPSAAHALEGRPPFLRKPDSSRCFLSAKCKLTQ